MENVFRNASSQDQDGWQGINTLLLEWLYYATSREARSMLRIHRSPQLRRTLNEFLNNEMVSKVLLKIEI